MEVKINREIRNYTEAVFLVYHFDRSFFCLRLCCCSCRFLSFKAVCGYRNRIVDLYSFRRSVCGTRLCEVQRDDCRKFVIAWVKSEFLTPKKLTFKSTNTYYELMKPSIERKAKEAMKAND